MQRQQTNYFGRDLEAMSFAVNYHRWIFREFRNYIGKHIVEVGAGTGTFSQLILKTNPSTFVAIEPSTNMYESLRDRIGGNPNVTVLNCNFVSALPKFSQAPDTVFYVNVLEHIEDDQGELDCVCRSLRPNGHLATPGEQHLPQLFNIERDIPTALDPSTYTPIRKILRSQTIVWYPSTDTTS